MFEKIRKLFLGKTSAEDEIMYVIAGLGNPDRKYENTRHNVGFDVIDALAAKYNISMNEKKHRAICGRGLVAGVKTLLVKPQTYMNLSGESIGEILRFYRLDPEIYASAQREAQEDTTESKASLQKPAAVIFPESKSAWVRSRRGGIWRIMC